MNRIALVVTFLVSLTATGQEPPGPKARPNGLITQGPYLFCGDNYGMFHLLHEGRPLLHGMGIYSGLNGYTTPEQIQAIGTKRKAGEVLYRGKARGHDITFDVKASISGRRIRIAIRRTGAWPGDTWSGFRIPLPVGRYAGGEYRANGEVGRYPAKYSGDQKIRYGVRKLEAHLGDPALNFVIESAVGFGLTDHRAFGGSTYAVSVGLPRGDREWSEFFITLPNVPGETVPTAVRWSHIGYPVSGEKQVVLEWSKYGQRPDDRARLERRDGKVVREGTFGKTSSVDYIQGNYAAFDFTEERMPGEYRVVWSGGKTAWFPIRKSVFEPRLWHPTLDTYLPFLMCHAEVKAGASGHGRCHMDDGVRAPAHFKAPDFFVSYESEGTPYEAGDRMEVAKGGWHDAGDHDLNVPAQSFSVWVMSLASEAFSMDRDVSKLDAKSGTFHPGSPDGIPDLVQQIDWGVEWLLRMQQENGRVYNGVCAKSKWRSGKRLGEITDGNPGTEDDRLVFVDYHADGQLNFVIAMAAASRALKKNRPDRAGACLRAARRAFEYFRKHKEVYRRGSYSAKKVQGKERDGSVMAAAIELYLTTGEGAYLDVVKALSGSLPALKLDWPEPRATQAGGFRYVAPFLARLHPRLQDGPFKTSVEETCRRAARPKSDRFQIRPWPYNTWHFGDFGNTLMGLARVFDTYWLSKVVPDVLAPEAALRSALWVYGLHPTCDTVFVSGLGYPEPRHLYSTHLHALTGSAPATVPGAVVPGMGGFWYSGIIAYIDEHGYWGHNESTIYGAALYLFAVEAMREMGF